MSFSTQTHSSFIVDQMDAEICISNDTKLDVTFALNELWIQVDDPGWPGCCHHFKFCYMYKTFLNGSLDYSKLYKEFRKNIFPFRKCVLQPKIHLAFENSIRPYLQKSDTGSVFCQNQFCKQAMVQTGLWLRKTEICQNLIFVNKKWVINFKWG